MSDAIMIRPARPDDSTIVHRFISELEEMDFDPALFEQYYLQNIAAADHIYLIAETETREVVGYLSCHGQLLLHHLGKVFEIQEMFVKHEFRSKGIGQLLIGELKMILMDRDCVSLEVTTNMKRSSTQAFYIRSGFDPTHVKFTTEDLYR